MADLLRGDDKQSEYGRAILPLVVLRRPDCVPEPTKLAVLKRQGELAGRIEDLDCRPGGLAVCNPFGRENPRYPLSVLVRWLLSAPSGSKGVPAAKHSSAA